MSTGTAPTDGDHALVDELAQRIHLQIMSGELALALGFARRRSPRNSESAARRSARHYGNFRRPACSRSFRGAAR